MIIQRDILDQLAKWKESQDRKPLLLWGARQVGKSSILKLFGHQYYKYVATFNFDNNTDLQAAFSNTQDIPRLIKELQFNTDCPIEKDNTLLIFDEIQECEQALNSLKYFHENAPEYHIVAAGSLLGVTVKKKHYKVPVGQVQIKNMYPISFKEFLRASDIKTYGYICDKTDTEKLPEIVLSKLALEYRRYLVCGGMPEAAKALLEGKSYEQIDEILKNILNLYEIDFAKYCSSNEVNRIKYVWNSLPSQLAKENKKFLYKVVKTGARAREYEDALLWLKDAGLIYQVFNVSSPKLPLSAYSDLSCFKVYALDCGLLRRLANLSAEVVMKGNLNFVEFKGALAENAVLQSLICQSNDDKYYWSSDNRAEVDFLYQYRDMIIPIEVKSDTRISGKSLSVYKEKYAPKLRVRLSLNNIQQNDDLLSLPLPLCCFLNNYADKVCVE